MENVMIEDVKIRWRHLSANDKMKPGKRYLTIKLDEDLAVQMKNDGWNVQVKVSPEDVQGYGVLAAAGWSVKFAKYKLDEPEFTLDVYANYEYDNPEIWKIANGRKILMTEGTVGTLDRAEIVASDILIRPHFWKTPDGKTGIQARVKELYMVAAESRLAEKYANLSIYTSDTDELDDDSVPF